MKLPLIILLTLSLFSCKKKSDSTDPVKPEDKAKAAALQEFLKDKTLSLTKYYSETPIDYIDTDQVVRSETDLWVYVSPWIPDDKYTFLDKEEVKIEQNVQKIESDPSPVLTSHYSAIADANGVAFNFVGHQYSYLKYRLISFSDTELKVNASWNGKTVISVYTIVP